MKKILLLLAAMTAMCVQAEDYLYIEDFEIDRSTWQATVPLKAVRYYNPMGQQMSEPHGITIVVTEYTDGTTDAKKVLR